MQTASYAYNNEQSTANTSRQVSGVPMNREQSAAGALVRSDGSYQAAAAYPSYNVGNTTTSYQSQTQHGAYAASYGGGSNVQYSAGHGGEYTSASRMMTGGERIQSTRKISSTIIDEQYMGSPPQDYPTREVEVPGPVQEVVKHVVKKEVREVERRVPRYDIEWVEKIVEVPRIEYVDKTVEIPQYQEVIREVKVPQIVEVPKEVVKEIKVPRVNYIEQVKEVPGQIIEVPKPYTVENKVEVTRYTDKQHPVVVAQTIKPYIVEGSGVYEVDVYEYEPECVPVDVHVVKAVQAQLNGQLLETNHRIITVPVAQYNTMLQQLNVHLTQAELQKLPYLTENGQVTFLNERISYMEPQHGVRIEGLDLSKMVVTHESRNQTSTSQTTTSMTTTGIATTQVQTGAYHQSSAGYQGSYVSSSAGRVSNAQYAGSSSAAANMLRPTAMKYAGMSN